MIKCNHRCDFVPDERYLASHPGAKASRCGNLVSGSNPNERCHLHGGGGRQPERAAARPGSTAPSGALPDVESVLGSSEPIDEVVAAAERDPEFAAVLEASARVQQIVPEAAVVGGTAAALWAGHRLSYDAAHVIGDLKDRFEMVLDALEGDAAWATNRMLPGKVILGNLGGVEVGVRQMRRRVPLEVVELTLSSGMTVRVPTPAETLRIKAFLVVRRNQTRDYLDVAALSDWMGVGEAAEVLRAMDRYYADQMESEDGVTSQLVRQLSDPRPVDTSVTRQLARYKKLDRRWARWSDVVKVLRSVAQAMVEGER